MIKAEDQTPDRYFLVSFNHAKGFGDLTFTTKGVYLNSKRTRDFIKSKMDYETEQCIIIMNIIELTKQDYLDYTTP